MNIWLELQKTLFFPVSSLIGCITIFKKEVFLSLIIFICKIIVFFYVTVNACLLGGLHMGMYAQESKMGYVVARLLSENISSDSLLSIGCEK